LKDTVEFNLYGSSVKPDFSISQGLPNVEVDSGQIKQVIANIVINAVQAMSRGGTLRVSASDVRFEGDVNEGDLSKGSYVKIDISDEGAGMSKEILSKIFTPFFSTKPSGRGLGLSMCHSIIKRHKGYITASSELNKGSTFTFYLSATEKSLQPWADHGQSVQKMSIKVLILDDEEGIQKLLQSYLGKMGAETELASSSSEALEKYRAAQEAGRPFDIVLLDMTIRGGPGGLETFHELQKADPGVQAIVMSGYSEHIALSETVNQGFKASIKKPFDLVDVWRTIRAVVLAARDKK